MDTVSYSDARNHLKRLCDSVVSSRKPTRIHRRGGDVVVVSAADWEAIQETLYVMSIPGAVERIRAAGDYKELKELTPEALAALIEE